MWTGELHVTPLTGILQMRPSFSYLDKADSKTREREAANEGVFNFQIKEMNGLIDILVLSFFFYLY